MFWMNKWPAFIEGGHGALPVLAERASQKDPEVGG